jgi:hypothetical protein
MTDLFVLTADAAMSAVFNAILARHEAMGIRQISFESAKHPGRDSGVFTTGPELIRPKRKTEYAYVLIAFDHHGSNCREPPDFCRRKVQLRLDDMSWRDRSNVVVIDPELEEWLWHNPASIAKTLDCSVSSLRLEETPHDPKQSLTRAFLEHKNRGPRPGDFGDIARHASLHAWTSSPSFRILKETLQNWFPTA